MLSNLSRKTFTLCTCSRDNKVACCTLTLELRPLHLEQPREAEEGVEAQDRHEVEQVQR